MADDRIGKTSTTSGRAGDASRTTRDVDTRKASKQELISRFRTEMFNNVLPKVPDIPGFHLCWLSANSSYDTIQHRETIGYELVKPSEIPGFDHVIMKDGPHAGYVGLKEMVLAKLPLDLYHEYMRIAHHDRPNEEQGKLRDTLRFIQDTAREGGADVYIGDGTNDMMQIRNPAPVFEGAES
jgi:hypothetical protein